MAELRITFPERAAAAAWQSRLNPALAAGSSLFLDNGIAVYDLQRWYRGQLPEHPQMAELLAAGWQQVPFADLSDQELEELSRKVNLFSKSPDWLSPALGAEPETAAEMAEQFANWLIPPEEFPE